MATRDGSFVSHLSGMCEQHDQSALWLIAQALDENSYSDARRLAWADQYLAEERAACVEQCGRAADESNEGW